MSDFNSLALNLWKKSYSSPTTRKVLQLGVIPPPKKTETSRIYFDKLVKGVSYGDILAKATLFLNNTDKVVDTITKLPMRVPQGTLLIDPQFTMNYDDAKKIMSIKTRDTTFTLNLGELARLEKNELDNAVKFSLFVAELPDTVDSAAQAMILALGYMSKSMSPEGHSEIKSIIIYSVLTDLSSKSK